jgi:6-phosphogluconolactonase
VFWGDERCVPADHPDSNFRQAFDLLLARVPLPPVNVYRVPTGSGDPTLAAAAYERTLRTFFRVPDGGWPVFDLVWLGLGADGHIASLFPHSEAIEETRRAVIATSGGQPNLPRVTLTLPVLNHAKHLVWLVAGAKKASIVREVLEGVERPEALPAQRVKLVHGTALWLIDRAAAGLLRAPKVSGGMDV